MVTMSASKLDYISDVTEALTKLSKTLGWGTTSLPSIRKMTSQDIERLALLLDEAYHQLSKIKGV